MTYQELKAHYGSDEKAAAEIGVSHATVRKWKANGIPRLTQLAIQTLTKSKLKAD